MEELIKIKGVGFGVRVDRRRKCNLISPLLLDFFDIRGTQDEDIGGCILDYSFDNIFRYVGKKVTRCSDNRLRRCKVYKACFEYEGCSFTLPFHLDRSLKVPAGTSILQYGVAIQPFHTLRMAFRTVWLYVFGGLKIKGYICA